MLRTSGELLDVPIDREAATPLFRQVYAGLTTAILERRLQPGAKLPASRVLAGRLGLLRTAIVSAYEQLLAEGYATGRVGSGTHVASDLPNKPDGRTRPVNLKRHTSHAVPRLAGNGDVTAQSDDRPFNLDRMLIDARTADQWRRLSARALRGMPSSHLGYGDSRGSEDLRRATAAYLADARAARCDPGQIIITGGTQHAIDLIMRTLLRWAARFGSRIRAIR